jgi:hypothetical protein
MGILVLKSIRRWAFRAAIVGSLAGFCLVRKFLRGEPDDTYSAQVTDLATSQIADEQVLGFEGAQRLVAQ